jgi:hypothetical protein
MLLERPDGLELIVPAKRNFFMMVFLLAWLTGWAFGEVTTIGELLSGNILSGNTKGALTFLLFWLVGWTLGGGCAVLVFLWMLAGRERIALQPCLLAIRREIFGLGLTRDYDLAHVRNVRVSAGAFDPFSWTTGARFWGIGGGLVAFDYGAKTVRVAASIDEPEAAQIVRELKGRHAFAE